MKRTSLCFLLLGILLHPHGQAPSSFTYLNGKTPIAGEQESADQKYWSTHTINVHQPIYPAGYGGVKSVQPLFLPPPPPQVLVNNMIPPSDTYLPHQLPIKTKLNVISYPMHLDNMFNHFQKPTSWYDQLQGPNSPGNFRHPLNTAYNTLPQNLVPPLGNPNILDNGV